MATMPVLTVAGVDDESPSAAVQELRVSAGVTPPDGGPCTSLLRLVDGPSLADVEARRVES